MAQEGVVASAVEAYQEAIALGHAEYSAKAAFNLGEFLSDDPLAAGIAYRQAIDSRHGEIAPRAAFNLARLFECFGEPLAARLLYEEAAALGDPEVAVNANSEITRHAHQALTVQDC